MTCCISCFDYGEARRLLVAVIYELAKLEESDETVETRNWNMKAVVL